MLVDGRVRHTQALQLQSVRTSARPPDPSRLARRLADRRWPGTMGMCDSAFGCEIRTAGISDPIFVGSKASAQNRKVARSPFESNGGPRSYVC